MWRRRLGVMAVLWGAGCGGGGGGPVPIDQLGPHLVQALCDYGVRCSSYPDLASCMSANGDSTPQLVADVKAGKTLYDAAQAGACLDGLAPSGCTRSSEGPIPAACDQAFKGTIAEGGACASGVECLSTICNFNACDISTTCCPGVCGPVRVTVAEGGVCGLPNTTCGTGMFCQFATGGASTCKRRGAAGAACTPGLECADGLTCVVSVGSRAGVCGSFPRTGEDCATTDGTCDARTDFCDPTTSKCTPRLAPGAACVPSASSCATYARCDVMSGKCVSLGGLGAACAAGSDCFSHQCVSGACAARPAFPVCP
jgi:Dickkopf N-terminal cysteine-rich region